MLAKHLSVKISELPLRGAADKGSASRVRGVHKSSGGKWWVRVNNEYRGTFDNEAEAIKVAGQRGRKRKRAISHDMMATTRALCTCFEDWIPADIEHLIAFRKAHPQFALLSGPLYLLAVLGKEDCTSILHVCNPH